MRSREARLPRCSGGSEEAFEFYSQKQLLICLQFSHLVALSRIRQCIFLCIFLWQLGLVRFSGLGLWFLDQLQTQRWRANINTIIQSKPSKHTHTCTHTLTGTGHRGGVSLRTKVVLLTATVQRPLMVREAMGRTLGTLRVSQRCFVEARPAHWRQKTDGNRDISKHIQQYRPSITSVFHSTYTMCLIPVKHCYAQISITEIINRCNTQTE